MTNPEALKELYVALGGEETAVTEADTSVEVLNAISEQLGGESDATLNPEAISNIAAVATGGGGGGIAELKTANVTIVDGSATGTSVVLSYFDDRQVRVKNAPLTIDPSDNRRHTATVPCHIWASSGAAYKPLGVVLVGCGDDSLAPTVSVNGGFGYATESSQFLNINNSYNTNVYCIFFGINNRGGYISTPIEVTITLAGGK